MHNSNFGNSTSNQHADLVAYFLKCATEMFDFLSPEPGFSCNSAVKVLGGKGFIEVTPEQVKGFFYVTVTFSTQKFILKISYGDRELDINSKVALISMSMIPEEFFGLGEWVEAIGYSNKGVDSGAWVTTKDRIKLVLSETASTFKNIQTIISNADNNLLEKLHYSRAKRLLQLQEKSLNEDYKRASKIAGTKFREKNYSEVVELLRPFTERLSESDRKKLEYAMSRL